MSLDDVQNGIIKLSALPQYSGGSTPSVGSWNSGFNYPTFDWSRFSSAPSVAASYTAPASSTQSLTANQKEDQENKIHSILAQVQKKEINQATPEQKLKKINDDKAAEDAKKQGNKVGFFEGLLNVGKGFVKALPSCFADMDKKGEWHFNLGKTLTTVGTAVAVGAIEFATAGAATPFIAGVFGSVAAVGLAKNASTVFSDSATRQQKLDACDAAGNDIFGIVGSVVGFRGAKGLKFGAFESEAEAAIAESSGKVSVKPQVAEMPAATPAPVQGLPAPLRGIKEQAVETPSVSKGSETAANDNVQQVTETPATQIAPVNSEPVIHPSYKATAGSKSVIGRSVEDRTRAAKTKVEDSDVAASTDDYVAMERRFYDPSESPAVKPQEAKTVEAPKPAKASKQPEVQVVEQTKLEKAVTEQAQTVLDMIKEGASKQEIEQELNILRSLQGKATKAALGKTAAKSEVTDAVVARLEAIKANLGDTSKTAIDALITATKEKCTSGAILEAANKLKNDDPQAFIELTRIANQLQNKSGFLSRTANAVGQKGRSTANFVLHPIKATASLGRAIAAGAPEVAANGKMAVTGTIMSGLHAIPATYDTIKETNDAQENAETTAKKDLLLKETASAAKAFGIDEAEIVRIAENDEFTQDEKIQKIDKMRTEALKPYVELYTKVLKGNESDLANMSQDDIKTAIIQKLAPSLEYLGNRGKITDKMTGNIFTDSSVARAIVKEAEDLRNKDDEEAKAEAKKQQDAINQRMAQMQTNPFYMPQIASY